MTPPSALPLSFTARVVRGAGRGRMIGSPTLNLALSGVPKALQSGIYACRVRLNRRTAVAAMHFGPRPVFDNSRTCEVHIIDDAVRRAPARLAVEVVQRLRSIRNFPSVAALQRQIKKDIEKARRILQKH